MLYWMSAGLRRCYKESKSGPRYFSGRKRVKPSLLRKAFNGVMNLTGFAIVTKYTFLTT